jgi:Peptidase inhibitor family I36
VALTAVTMAPAVPAYAATVARSGPATVTAPAATGYARCPSHHLCVFNGFNGTGAYCAYVRPARANAVQGCRFEELGWKARSVWNRHVYDEALFRYRNYSSLVVFLFNGQAGNISGTYQVRSFGEATIVPGSAPTLQPQAAAPRSAG